MVKSGEAGFVNFRNTAKSFFYKVEKYKGAKIVPEHTEKWGPAHLRPPLLCLITSECRAEADVCLDVVCRVLGGIHGANRVIDLEGARYER